MGAGSELFAAAAHGYEPAVLQRIKPIARSADNATAAAWRTDELRIVPADTAGHGAIVAPMLRPGGCVGVLAAETRSGREQDEATQSVATIVASQLASVLAAWPAASTTAAETARPEGRRVLRVPVAFFQEASPSATATSCRASRLSRPTRRYVHEELA